MFLSFTTENRNSLTVYGKVSSRLIGSGVAGFLEVIPSEETKEHCLVSEDGKYFVAVEVDEKVCICRLPKYPDIGVSGQFPTDRLEDLKNNPPELLFYKRGEYIPGANVTSAIDQINVI